MAERVMVLEDERSLYELLEALLGLEGYEVIKPQEPSNLIEEMHQVEPQAVLIDVHLDGVNGLDLLDAIRADQNLRDTLVVLTSGMDYHQESLH